MGVILLTILVKATRWRGALVIQSVVLGVDHRNRVASAVQHEDSPVVQALHGEDWTQGVLGAAWVVGGVSGVQRNVRRNRQQ